MTLFGVRRSAPTRLFLVGLAALVTAPLLASCSDDGAKDAPLDQVAPTKAEIADEAGIEFPSSTDGFRLVRISPSQVDVTFTLDPDQVDAFASGSGLELREGQRVIMHASPIWDLAVDGTVRGGSSVRDGVKRSAEVVADGDLARIRLTLLSDSA